MSLASELFEFDLPAWTDESPHRLYALFRRHNGQAKPPLDKEEHKELTKLLANVIGLVYAQFCLQNSLPPLRLDPQDAAQESLIFIERKTRTMKINHEGWRVMLRILRLSIYRQCLTQIESQKRRMNEMPASDYYISVGKGPEHTGIDSELDKGACRCDEGLARVLLASEDDVIGDVVCRSNREQTRVEALYNLMRDQLIKDGTILAHASLPEHLRIGVSYELCNLIVSRLLRIVRAYAAGE